MNQRIIKGTVAVLAGMALNFLWGLVARCQDRNLQGDSHV